MAEEKLQSSSLAAQFAMASLELSSSEDSDIRQGHCKQDGHQTTSAVKVMQRGHTHLQQRNPELQHFQRYSEIST